MAKEQQRPILGVRLCEVSVLRRGGGGTLEISG